MAHPLCCEQVNRHCRNPSSRSPAFPVGSPSCGPMTHGCGPLNFLQWEVGLSSTTSKSTPFPTRSQAWSQNLLDSRVVPRARCLLWTVRVSLPSSAARSMGSGAFCFRLFFLQGYSRSTLRLEKTHSENRTPAFTNTLLTNIPGILNSDAPWDQVGSTGEGRSRPGGTGGHGLLVKTLRRD